jgi:hypothetical protein
LLRQKLAAAARVRDDPAEKLDAFIGKQQADNEPSPLDVDTPERQEGKPREAKGYGARR